MKPFFSSKEKYIAKVTPRPVLQRKYEKSERRLQDACRTGKVKNVKDAMAVHHTYEYALLYQTFSGNKK